MDVLVIIVLLAASAEVTALASFRLPWFRESTSDPAKFPHYHYDRPEFIELPGQQSSGQILRRVYIRNSGREPAYDLIADRWLKAGTDHYERFPGCTQPPERLTIESHLLPRGDTTRFPVVSICGVSRDYFNTLLTGNRTLGVLVILKYTDYNRTVPYSDLFCTELEHDGPFSVAIQMAVPVFKADSRDFVG